MLSIEISPVISFRKILYFFFKTNKNFSFISVPFNKRKNFKIFFKFILFLGKIGISPLIHYHYNYSFKNVNLYYILLKNNKIKKLLFLRGDFNYLKKKNDNFFFFFKKKSFFFFSTFYPSLNKNSICFKKDFIILKNKIINNIIILQQSFCLISFIIFFEFLKLNYKKFILGFFLFTNYNSLKNLTFNCNIFLNNWNKYFFCKNFNKKYCF